MNKWIKEYQCTGCVNDGEDCYCKTEGAYQITCKNHVSGTFTLIMGGVVKLYLGLPTGFTRTNDYMSLHVFENFNNAANAFYSFDHCNVPVWKHLNEHGHTLIRGMLPRTGETFTLVILENCMNEFNCIEITEKDMKEMD